jgi:hypothetical protein
MSIILTAHSSVMLHVTFLTENTQFVVFECSDHIIGTLYLFIYLFSLAVNF